VQQEYKCQTKTLLNVLSNVTKEHKSLHSLP